MVEIDKNYILDVMRAKNLDIKKYGIIAIGLFGSFVREEQKPDSDIDILIEFCEGMETFDNYMDLKYFLEDLFSRKVDLVIKHSIKLRVKEKILKETLYA